MRLAPARRRQRGFIINPFVFGAGGGGGGGGDPYFANVVSLLHMDGSDGSTTFTDVKGRAWTAAGNAQIDTAQSKFGGASGLFDGTGDYVTTPNSTDFQFGTGDFTFEVWARLNTTAALQNCICWTSASGPVQVIINDGAGKMGIYAQTSWVIQNAVTQSTATWYHLAWTRSGNNWRVFMDGVQQGSTVVDSRSLAAPNGVRNIAIGAEVTAPSYSQFYNGWLDDLRVTKGVARYTANFTPPTAAFPDS
jgi:hypothetical protein